MIDKSKPITIRNKSTGAIRTAYQGDKPWIVTDEKGREIMSDWEVVEDGGFAKCLLILVGIIVALAAYWVSL